MPYLWPNNPSKVDLAEHTCQFGGGGRGGDQRTVQMTGFITQAFPDKLNGEDSKSLPGNPDENLDQGNYRV